MVKTTFKKPVTVLFSVCINTCTVGIYKYIHCQYLKIHALLVFMNTCTRYLPCTLLLCNMFHHPMAFPSMFFAFDLLYDGICIRKRDTGSFYCLVKALPSNPLMFVHKIGQSLFPSEPLPHSRYHLWLSYSVTSTLHRRIYLM